MEKPLFVGTGPVLMDQFVHCDVLPESEDLPEPGSKLQARDDDHMERVRKEWVEGWSSISQVGGPVQVALRQTMELGADVRFVGSVGSDDSGLYMLSTMILQGFRREDIVVQEGRRSGSAIVWIDRQGERSILFDKGSLEPVPTQTAESLLDVSPQAVFIDSREFEAALRIGQLAQERGIPVHYDIDPWESWTPELLNVSNVAQVSYRSALENSPHKGTPEEICAAMLKGSSLELAVVTNSEQGLHAVGRDGSQYRVPAALVDGVDSTGAGDVFAGAYEWARFEQRSIQDSLRYGAAAAADHVTRLGNANVPSVDAIELILMEMPRG